MWLWATRLILVLVRMRFQTASCDVVAVVGVHDDVATLVRGDDPARAAVLGDPVLDPSPLGRRGLLMLGGGRDHLPALRRHEAAVS
jgi:hypothetical protein